MAYITIDDLKNNAVIEDGDFSDLQVQWIIKFTTNQIDNITGFALSDFLDGAEYPGNLTSFQQSCINNAAVLLAKQMVACGSDELIRGGASISTGSLSINQTNPNDPYYVHPQVYDFLTKAGFYNQVQFGNLKSNRGIRQLPIDTPDAQLEFVTVEYVKKNLIGKPVAGQSNRLIGTNGVKVTFNGTGDGFGTTTVEMDLDIVKAQINQSIGNQVNSIAQLVGNRLLSDEEWQKQITTNIKGILENDGKFLQVFEGAIRGLLEQDSQFKQDLANDTNFQQIIIDAITSQLTELVKSTFIDSSKTVEIDTLNTTDKTLSGAINELEKSIENISVKNRYLWKGTPTELMGNQALLNLIIKEATGENDTDPEAKRIDRIEILFENSEGLNYGFNTLFFSGDRESVIVQGYGLPTYNYDDNNIYVSIPVNIAITVLNGLQNGSAIVTFRIDLGNNYVGSWHAYHGNAQYLSPPSWQDFYYEGAENIDDGGDMNFSHTSTLDDESIDEIIKIKIYYFSSYPLG